MSRIKPFKILLVLFVINQLLTFYDLPSNRLSNEQKSELPFCSPCLILNLLTDTLILYPLSFIPYAFILYPLSFIPYPLSFLLHPSSFIL